MNKPLELAALIRCLEVMADEANWREEWYGEIFHCRYCSLEMNALEVCKAALPIVRSILDNQNAHVPYGHDRISNQELKP